jgi:transglutaminase-like putative cysteine protease
MRRYLTSTITAIAGFIFLAFSSFAQTEFDTEYLIRYDISPSGETLVTYNIKIINKSSDIVATKYALSIRQMSIYDVEGSDRRGPLEVETEVEGDMVTIITELNEHIVGEGRENNFTITYKTRSVATKVGDIWNINISQTQNLDLTNLYDVSIFVPNAFGPKIFVSPTPVEELEENNGTTLIFNKDMLIDQGISASYGEYQTINYQIRYQLSNNSIFSSVQEVALIPEIDKRQKVFYTNINPKPVKVRTDKDGNVLAYFKVDAKSTLEVVLTGSVRLTGEQIEPLFGGKMEDITNDLAKQYTRERKYWEVDSPEIKDIAQKLFDPEYTVAQNAQKIYNFVTEYLQYDFALSTEEFIERKGALKALATPELAACMEYTDLFISVARAMGIPAREINGYAFNNTDDLLPLSIDLKGGDLLHAWPEFYDPSFGWVAVDPTWGSTSGMDYFTKLDTNHVAFVIKGQNSEYPLPAGAYRTNDHEKLIEIDFARNENREFTEASALEQAQSFVEKQRPSVFTYLGAFLLALGLCMTIYLLIIHPDYPKKAVDHLRRRPQDPDQQSNQNS